MALSAHVGVFGGTPLLGEQEGCTLRGVAPGPGRPGRPDRQRSRGGLCGAMRNGGEALWTDLTGSNITVPTKGMKKQEHTRHLSPSDRVEPNVTWAVTVVTV